jgi:hypothetical protein
METGGPLQWHVPLAHDSRDADGCVRRPRNLVDPCDVWFITPLVVPSARRDSPLLFPSDRDSKRVIDGGDAWRESSVGGMRGR